MPGAGIVDVVLANNRLGDPATLRPPSEPVRARLAAGAGRRRRGSSSTTSSTAAAAQRHDPDRLAAAVMRILEREGAPGGALVAPRTA